MTAGVGVLGRMGVRRVVAAERAAALLTRTEMNPLAADLDAFLTHVLVRPLDRRNRPNVSTGAGRIHEILEVSLT
jgi:hypothetical protein